MPLGLCVPVFSAIAGSYASAGLLILLGPIGILVGAIQLALAEEGIPLLNLLVNAALTTVAIAVLLKVAGRIGAIIMVVLGIAGIPFSAGATAILTVIGGILVAAPKAIVIAIAINLIIYGMAGACYAAL